MVSTPILLALSPAAWPPMPSQTTKIPFLVSKPKLSSLLLRTTPTSLFPAARSVRFMTEIRKGVHNTVRRDLRKAQMRHDFVQGLQYAHRTAGMPLPVNLDVGQ